MANFELFPRFMKDSVQKAIVLISEDDEILTNEEIELESLSFSERLYDSELKFGSMCSNSLELDVFGIEKETWNKKNCKAYMCVYGAGGMGFIQETSILIEDDVCGYLTIYCDSPEYINLKVEYQCIAYDGSIINKRKRYSFIGTKRLDFIPQCTKIVVTQEALGEYTTKEFDANFEMYDVVDLGEYHIDEVSTRDIDADRYHITAYSKYMQGIIDQDISQTLSDNYYHTMQYDPFNPPTYNTEKRRKLFKPTTLFGLMNYVGVRDADLHFERPAGSRDYFTKVVRDTGVLFIVQNYTTKDGKTISNVEICAEKQIFTYTNAKYYQLIKSEYTFLTPKIDIFDARNTEIEGMYQALKSKSSDAGIKDKLDGAFAFYAVQGESGWQTGKRSRLEYCVDNVFPPDVNIKCEFPSVVYARWDGGNELIYRGNDYFAGQGTGTLDIEFNVFTDTIDQVAIEGDIPKVTTRQLIEAYYELHGSFYNISRNGKLTTKKLDKKNAVRNPFVVGTHKVGEEGLTVGYFFDYPTYELSDYETFESEDLAEKRLKYAEIDYKNTDGEIATTYYGLVAYPQGTVVYQMRDNWLLKNVMLDGITLQSILEESFGQNAREVSIVEGELVARGNPVVEVGDYIKIITKRHGKYVIPVTSRTMKGIQSLKDTIKSEGVKEDVI